MDIKIAICVPIKNETLYLEEWLDYHLSIGISDIYLYEDEGSDDHSTITSKYSNVHLNYISNVLNSDFYKGIQFDKQGSWKQTYLYKWFYHEYKHQYDWILMIDVDEFLILKQPLQDIVNQYKHLPAIMFKWKIMTASGHVNKPAGKVMDNYKNVYYKGFDNPVNTKCMINCHLNETLEWEIYNHKVKDAEFPLNKGHHLAVINHYFTKSWEEWKSKLLIRGDLMVGHRKIEQFFTINEDMAILKDQLLKEIK